MPIGWENNEGTMKIALAQINPTVGNITGNCQKIIENIEKAKSQHCGLVVFPEMCVVGYPPKDLLLKNNLIRENRESLQKLAAHTQNITAIVGFVDQKGDALYNAAAVIQDEKIIHIYHKIHLPNYDVFDEKRYFKVGEAADLITINGVKIGLNICEDIWIDTGPAYQQSQLGADLIINISASPFHAGKASVREELLSKRAGENKTPVLYVNAVGAQDDLIFDGRSYLFNAEGKMLMKAKAFEEDFLVLPELTAPPTESTETGVEDVYQALVLGVRDYFRKNGFKKAILGLSGGIDSALTAALAVDALGKENVVGITMPSRFSSAGSVDDSQLLAHNLGIRIHTIAIKDIFDNYVTSLSPHFRETSFNVAEENIQARIRGNLLMALSNKFGYLVLATGNKSELSVGYATLYGDMCGGLAVISDVFKGMVYELSHHVNRKAGREIIPAAIIEKEPSAELRDNQKDSDSLPVYPILDPILKAYVEDEKSKEEIVALGFEEKIVSKVIKMVDRNEYKRQQAALGLRITPRAFGSGRRMPITNGWKE